jgi:hypothetical protein
MNFFVSTTPQLTNPKQVSHLGVLTLNCLKTQGSHLSVVSLFGLPPYLVHFKERFKNFKFSPSQLTSEIERSSLQTSSIHLCPELCNRFEVLFPG